MRDQFGHQKDERYDGEPAWSEDTGEEQQRVPVEEATTPEPEPEEPAPLGYIEVRTERWSTFDGYNIKEASLITMRPRLPEDGEAPFRIVTTPPPIPIQEAKDMANIRREFGWHGDWTPGVPEALIRRVLTNEENDANNRVDGMSRWSGFAREK